LNFFPVVILWDRSFCCCSATKTNPCHTSRVPRILSSYLQLSSNCTSPLECKHMAYSPFSFQWPKFSVIVQMSGRKEETCVLLQKICSLCVPSNTSRTATRIRPSY
jgi:hypothetical protein